MNALSIDYLGIAAEKFPVLERDAALEQRVLEDRNMQILHKTLSKYKPTKIYSLDVIMSVGYRVVIVKYYA